MVAHTTGMRSTTKSFLSSLLAACVGASVLATAPVASAHIIDTGFHLMAPALEGKLNVNTATAQQWELLPGIGPSIAAKLVDYSKRHEFKDPLHVMRVQGIGRKTYDKIKPFLTLSGPTTLQVVGKAKNN